MNATDIQTLFSGAANETSRLLVCRLALADCHIDDTLGLVAAVYKQAIKDARQGDVDATDFLDLTAPDWRHLSSAAPTNCTERAMRRATLLMDV